MSDEDRDTGKGENRDAWKTFTEEIEVASGNLISEINRLIAEGNVRKLEVRSEKGDIAISIPLTAGAVAGGIVALAAPWLVIVGAIAGIVAKVKVSVIREIPPEADDREDGPPSAP